MLMAVVVDDDSDDCDHNNCDNHDNDCHYDQDYNYDYNYNHEYYCYFYYGYNLSSRLASGSNREAAADVQPLPMLILMPQVECDVWRVTCDVTSLTIPMFQFNDWAGGASMLGIMIRDVGLCHVLASWLLRSRCDEWCELSNIAYVY
jgi:hypothetical protein